MSFDGTKLPNDWSFNPLGKHINIVGGYAFKSSLFEDIGIPIIRISNLTGCSVNFESCVRIAPNNIGKGDKYRLQAGDTLIAMSGATTGKLGYVPDDLEELCLLNQRLGVFRIQDKTKFIRNYLRAILNSEQFQDEVKKLAWGAAQPNISSKQLASVKIPLPPLPEQKRIAAILDAADALRSKRRQSIAELDTLLQATFLEMFGDPVTNPKGWDVNPLSDLGSLDRGVSKHRPRNAPELLGGKYPLIQTGDVANSAGYIKIYHSTYSEIGLNQSKIWAAGTLCITIAANIASTGILEFDACFPDSVVGFVAKNEGGAEYVQGLFWFFKQILDQQASQVAQKNINLKILRNFEVPCPPLELQQEFATIVQTIEAQKARMQAHLQELDTLFAALQQRAFNGEL